MERFYLKGYYFITDSRLSLKGIYSDTRAAVRANAAIVQYRSKDASARRMYLEALKLRKICKDTVFLINDRVDIALAVEADGIHLGQSDLPYEAARKLLGKSKIIGITVHSLKQAQEAAEMGADYIGVAPVFFTRTKADAGRPVGAGLIRRIRKKVSVPLVALGGITLTNASEVIFQGADAVCAVSQVVTRPDVAGEILKFQKLFSNNKTRFRG